MGPKPKGPQTRELFGQPLAELINGNHPLAKLAELIDWNAFEREWSALFPSGRGRPAAAPRLVAGLLYLQHTFACSDEALIWTWVENPYWQHFCGETYFQHEPPIDPSSLSRWRKRIGEEGVEWLLTVSIEAARKAKVIKAASVEKVIVDTTVMEKAIAYPTDSRLLERGRQHLVKLADRLGIPLRQNYNRQAPRLAGQVGRYAHAKQYKRMRATLKKLHTLVGRVWRDIDRQRESLAPEHTQRVGLMLGRVRRLLDQKPKDKNKLYSLHAPEVECIAKGKARQPYEFGVKVTVATTHKEGLVVGMRSLPGNPFDGHTLAEAIEQVEILTEQKPKAVFVDKGYQGAEVPAGVPEVADDWGIEASVTHRSTLTAGTGARNPPARGGERWRYGIREQPAVAGAGNSRAEAVGGRDNCRPGIMAVRESVDGAGRSRRPA